MQYEFIKDFYKERQNKIGSSDILYCVPHPEKAIESLGAFTDNEGQRHPQTAIDLYNKKLENPAYESNFAAEMGKFIEVRAISEFIKDFISPDIAFEFERGYQLHKLEQELKSHKADRYICENPEPYNNTPFLHNTKSDNEYASVHADCIYNPEIGIPWNKNHSDKGRAKIKKDGITIDLSKPFIVEAKTANYFSVMRRQKDQYRGYDLSLSGFQGIDLGHYFQIQYQMLVYEVDIAYLSLIYNTNSKHFWKIEANPSHQKDLKQIAIYMKRCLDEKIPPKDLLMNSKDIRALYPEIKEDFKEVKDDELKTIIQTAKKYIEAKDQEKAWKEKKEQYEDTMSIHLKDTQLLKGNINGMFLDLAKWKETGGGEYTMSLKDIRSREDAQTVERYLKRKKLIKQSQKNRKPSIMIKEKDLEGWEDENNNIR